MNRLFCNDCGSNCDLRQHVEIVCKECIDKREKNELTIDSLTQKVNGLISVLEDFVDIPPTDLAIDAHEGFVEQASNLASVLHQFADAIGANKAQQLQFLHRED